MTEKNKYSIWIGVWKAIKNNLVVLIPFFLAVLAEVPVELAPIASLLAYYLKNLYEQKVQK